MKEKLLSFKSLAFDDILKATLVELKTDKRIIKTIFDNNNNLYKYCRDNNINTKYYNI